MKVDVFISYAHKDRELREELAKHLSSLRNGGIINDWFDGDITGGAEWEKELLNHLKTAQIILLLISADFIASDFCYNVEMQQALARHDKNIARVIPIILRSTDWKVTPLAKLQALPTDGKAITLWPDRDKAFVDVVEGIKRAIRDLQSSASHPNNTVSPIPQKPPSNSSAPSGIQSISPLTPSVRNHIGSISGNNHSIIQAGTHSITTNNYSSSPDEICRSSSSFKKRIRSKKEK